MGGRSVCAGGAVTGGVIQTTAATTAAGLMIAIARQTPKKMRTGRDRTMRTMTSLVRQVFELGRELAHPTTIVQPSDEAAVPLVASYVQELLLCNQRPKAGQVRIRAVAHDSAYYAGQLAPLSLRERFAIAGDRHQQSGRRSGDGVGQQLFGFSAPNDLATRADDVGDAVSPDADDVATTAHSGAFEVARACFHRDPLL